jgi:folate-binding protein YgfZ
MSAPDDCSAATLRAVIGGAGLFRLAERGLLEVTGSERVRWLDGMVTASVAPLVPGDGTHALALTQQGRIVADLHLRVEAERIVADLEREAVEPLRAHLDARIIADDVTLRDASEDAVHLALEGPEASAVLARAGASLPELGLGAFAVIELAGFPVTAAAYGFTGMPALQLFVPPSAAGAVGRVLIDAGAIEASPDVLECLRIAAGAPRLGHDIDETVLPAEARLERVISTTKGCYTGQEVVARMSSRGRVSHLLVGLAFDGSPPSDALLKLEGREVGEVTSVFDSPLHGAIGLGYVRADRETPGTRLSADGCEVEVVALPHPVRGPLP